MDALKYITPKFFTTIKDYSKGQFIKDLIAGVIVAIIALPLQIALAIASGVNPEQGIYTAVVAGFFISFLGGSWVQIGGNHRSNAELVGQGIGNIMSALFGGIPVTGAIARTAANVKNGGRKPVAGMVHAFTLLLMLLFLMPYASLLPMICLASILMIVGYNMSGWRTVCRMIKRAPKSDVAVLLVTFILTVFFDLVVAIEFGMVLAAFLFLKRMSDVAQIRQWVDKENLDDPVLSEDSDLKQVPQKTVVYEVFGALFFGAANNFLNVINDETKNVLILRMRNVPAMDISGLDALEETLAICQKRGMTLLLSHVNDQPYLVLEKSGFIQTIGADHICESTDQALEKAVALAKEAQAHLFRTRRKSQFN